MTDVEAAIDNQTPASNIDVVHGKHDLSVPLAAAIDTVDKEGTMVP